MIGAGRIGQVHAKTLAYRLPSARLAGVADVKDQLARDTATRFGGVRWTDEPLELIHSPDVQAVVIASPRETHARYIIEAARAGKPIFCEKPVDRDVERMEEALAVVDETGVPLQLGFQRRYDNAHIHARHMVEEGKLGQVVFAHSHTRDATPHAEYAGGTGGIFRDTCVHDFDALRFILGDDVVEVTAVSNVNPERGFVTASGPEIASVSLRYARGTLAQVNTVRGILYGFDVRTEIIGTEATVAGGFQRDTLVTDVRREGETLAQAYWFPQRFAQAYVEEMRAWVDNVLAGRPVTPTGDDGRQALRLAVAAEESLRRGGQTVDLYSFEQGAAQPEPARRAPPPDDTDDEMEVAPGDIY